MHDRARFRVAQSAQEVEQALQIRRRVFVEEQRIPADLDEDGFDETAVHVLGFAAGKPIATGRLVLSGDGRGRLARIAILPDHRGGGLGRQIVIFLERVARDKGLREVSLEPHRHLEAFYGKLGYRTVPGSSSKAGSHELITMSKVLGPAGGPRV